MSLQILNLCADYSSGKTSCFPHVSILLLIWGPTDKAPIEERHRHSGPSPTRGDWQGSQLELTRFLKTRVLFFTNCLIVDKYFENLNHTHFLRHFSASIHYIKSS